MIVSVTRDDLRDEFSMADEAFALSPISARAAQPREEDYDAISEAFMETSRGRWFLGEYAKRNRNADTRMVLDAVARIEESLAAQKQTGLQRETSLAARALAAIGECRGWTRPGAACRRHRRRLEAKLAEHVQGAVAATSAVDASCWSKTGAVRKGARVIREISWRLREIGADGRICDLINSQVGAIEAGCGQISSDEPSALRAAFASIAAGSPNSSDDAAPQRIAALRPLLRRCCSRNGRGRVEEAVVAEAPLPRLRRPHGSTTPVAVAETIEADPVEVAPVEMAGGSPDQFSGARSRAGIGGS